MITILGASVWVNSWEHWAKEGGATTNMIMPGWWFAYLNGEIVGEYDVDGRRVICDTEEEFKAVKRSWNWLMTRKKAELQEGGTVKFHEGKGDGRTEYLVCLA